MARLFPKVAVQSHIPNTRVWGSEFPHHTNMCYLTFSVPATLVHVKQYLIMVLNNIFLIVNQHLFMYLLVICISSLEKYTFRHSAHFKKLGYFFLLLNCKLLYILYIYFYILQIQVPYHTDDLQKLSSILWIVFSNFLSAKSQLSCSPVFLFFCYYLWFWCQSYKFQMTFCSGTRYILRNADLVADGPWLAHCFGACSCGCIESYH